MEIRQDFAGIGILLNKNTIHNPLPGAGRRPYLYSMVPTAGGDVAAIGGPGHCSHGISVTSVGKENSPCVCVPDLHRVCIAARGNAAAVWRPGQRTRLIGLPFVDEEKVVRVSIQNMHRAVSIPCGDVASIGGPGQRLYDASEIERRIGNAIIPFPRASQAASHYTKIRLEPLKMCEVPNIST